MHTIVYIYIYMYVSCMYVSIVCIYVYMHMYVYVHTYFHECVWNDVCRTMNVYRHYIFGIYVFPKYYLYSNICIHLYNNVIEIIKI